MSAQSLFEAIKKAFPSAYFADNATLCRFHEVCPYYDLDGVVCNEEGGTFCPQSRQLEGRD